MSHPFQWEAENRYIDIFWYTVQRIGTDAKNGNVNR